ncbi:hypothetical protein ACJMK2_008180 [Sinanodonta woodiana]|uniref:DUF7789 domain-containing protein n=1 Tax=Sinanodonta woodiana TaxID=1069815 RepID=A0ABD3VNB4_SINWO
MEGTGGQPVTYADLGINVDPPIKDTVLGKVRKFSDLNKKEIVFMAVSGVALVACLGLTIKRMVDVDKSNPDFTFTLVLLFNILFCSYYISTGIVFEKPYELMIFIIGVIIVWLYLIVNYAVKPEIPFKLSRLIIASVLSPVIFVLGGLIAKNYHDSGNLIFRTVGANAILQDMCKNMFIFLGFLKLDLQLGVTLAVLVLTKGSVLSTHQIILLCVVGVLTLASFLFGHFAVRLENKKLMYIYASLWIFLPAYTVYCIVQTAKDLQENATDSLKIVTFICCVLSMCARCTIIYFGIQAYRSFGHGLKEKVYGALDSSNTAQRTLEGSEPALTVN